MQSSWSILSVMQVCWQSFHGGLEGTSRRAGLSLVCGRMLFWILLWLYLYGLWSLASVASCGSPRCRKGFGGSRTNCCGSLLRTTGSHNWRASDWYWNCFGSRERQTWWCPFQCQCLLPRVLKFAYLGLHVARLCLCLFMRTGHAPSVSLDRLSDPMLRPSSMSESFHLGSNSLRVSNSDMRDFA